MFDLKAFREQELPTQKEITSLWKGEATSCPVVSVICTAFNQENYIEDALRGFLMQKTDFPFEIIIHDDASTDNTKRVINRFKTQYPDIVKPIFQEANQFSQNVNLPLQNCFSVALGSYLAFCEGDDFWIDKYKLQKQVGILDNNHNIGLVLTDFNILYQERQVIREACVKNQPKSFPIADSFNSFLFARSYMAPCTWVMRREYFYKATYKTLDGTFCWLLDILEETIIKVLTDVTSVYRVLDESASHSKSFSKMLIREEDILNMQLIYCDKKNIHEALVKKIINNHINRTLHINIALNNKGNISTARKAFFELNTRGKALCFISFLPYAQKITRLIYNYKNLLK